MEGGGVPMSHVRNDSASLLNLRSPHVAMSTLGKYQPHVAICLNTLFACCLGLDRVAESIWVRFAVVPYKSKEAV